MWQANSDANFLPDNAQYKRLQQVLIHARVQKFLLQDKMQNCFNFKEINIV